MSEKVDHPDHYNQHPVECIDVVENMDFCTGSAIKYLWRWREKGGVEDLEKARWYINRLIRREVAKNAFSEDEVLQKHFRVQSNLQAAKREIERARRHAHDGGTKGEA